MRLLLTTFGPYEEWATNTSQLAVERLELDHLDADIEVHQYPVDFGEAKTHVLADHESSPDLLIHVGQSKRASKVELEMIAVNYGRQSDEERHFLLEPQGPPAFCCQVDYDRIARALAAEEIPAEVSFHAGVFVCNAVFYWSHFAAAAKSYQPKIALVHLPLDPAQRENREPGGSLPIQQSTRALELVLETLIQQHARA